MQLSVFYAILKQNIDRYIGQLLGEVVYGMYFFGHKDILEDIKPALKQTITDLIKNNSVDTFYVGDKGDFDNIVRKTLKELKSDYPHIKYFVIPAYMPTNNDGKDTSDYLCPYVFENTPPKFAIIKRNKWMLSVSDFVITYVTHSIGGAAQFKELAERQGNMVINLHNTK